MTNATIIFNAQQQLLQEGKLRPTGRMLRFETADGVQMLPEAEDIPTFQRWKALGYQVRKGEHAVADFSIWKYTTRVTSTEDEENAQESGYCFLKRSFWFSASQVDPIQ